MMERLGLEAPIYSRLENIRTDLREDDKRAVLEMIAAFACATGSWSDAAVSITEPLPSARFSFLDFLQGEVEALDVLHAVIMRELYIHEACRKVAGR